MPGVVPGGISGEVTVSKHSEGGTLSGEHDRFPTHRIYAADQVVRTYEENWSLLPALPVPLSGPWPNTQFNHRLRP